MDHSLHPLIDVLDRADERLHAGAHAAPRVWPTGFAALDRALSGGLRSGELVLLAGPQGLGKTTWTLQAARNLAVAGRSVLFFSFEHDPQALLVRLLTLEAGLAVEDGAPDLGRVRAALEAADGGQGALEERLGALPGGLEALRTVASYAPRMVLHRSSGGSTTLEVIRAAVEDVRQETGQLPVVFVDYLQKVRAARPELGDEDRTTSVVEGLKDLALDIDVPVLAIAAADKLALEPGRRMRVNHLRGSSALAYEADTVLVLNHKFDVVARHHLMFDVGNADRFRRWAVLSVEKNRSGRDGIDLEFHKRFEQARFDPEGQLVREQLVDDRVFTE